MNKKKILITGGAGYIGSITNQILKNEGYETVVFDNLQRGFKDAVGDTPFIKGDLRIKEDIDRVFANESFDAVIHFAALALAGESMQNPFKYFDNNIRGGLNLLDAMQRHNCNMVIFSSTCAVYGYPEHLPVTEEETIKPVSVYGLSKRMFEQILESYGFINKMKYVILRYFNAAGAMLDGSLGERHVPETHIIPLALDVASGKRQIFEVYGNDYETQDGTCVRDYIHVVDLAQAHIDAMGYLQEGGESQVINLGVGRGYSNLEVLKSVEEVTGKQIPLNYAPRRPGDPASIYADNTKAQKILGWEPKYSDLHTIIETAWKWHSANPKGYEDRH